MQDVGQRLAPGSATRPVLRSLWRFRSIVVGVTLLCALLGWGLSQLQAERYEATADIMLTDPREATLFPDATPPQRDPVRYVRNQARRLTSTPVAAQAAKRLDDQLTVTEVRDRVEAAPANELDLITVTASGPTGEEAAALANAVVQAYRDVVQAEANASAEEAVEELRGTLSDIQTRINEAERRLRQSPDDEVARLQLDADVSELLATQQLIERITSDAKLYGASLQMVEPAVPPDDPVAPRTLRNTILAALLGVGGATAVTVWRGDALRRADRRHEPQEVLGVPLLGTIPDLGDLELDEKAAYPTVSDPDSPTAEAFRFAASAIEAKVGPDVRTIVVTSAGAGDGKTTVALNLAVALRLETRRTLLVDADARMHGLSRLTGTESLRGLTDVTEGDCMLSEAIHAWPPGTPPNVSVGPIGRRQVDPAVFFRTVRYRSLLNRLRQQDYLTVVDAPPLLAVSDASAIAGSADAIVLVVNRGTPVRLLQDLRERLEFVGTPVLGFVFNRAADRRHGYGYGYGQRPRSPEDTDTVKDVGAGKDPGRNLGFVPPFADPSHSSADGNGSGNHRSDRRQAKQRRRKRAARTRGR